MSDDSSSDGEEDDPVEFLLARRPSPAAPPSEPQPEPQREHELLAQPELGLLAPEPGLSIESEPENLAVPLPMVTALDAASTKESQRPRDSKAGGMGVPSWLASLPNGRVGPNGKVDFAYHSLDDVSLVRVMHWLLAQRKIVRSLHLQCNSIVVLSDWVGQLTAIEELHLSHNQLTSLPSSLGRLVNLKTLCVDHNRLATLPECLRLLDKVELVEVEHNPLTSPPIEVCRDGISSINSFFARRMEARQRLAFGCAFHTRLGVGSAASQRNMCLQTLAYLGDCGVLESGFVQWHRRVAQRYEEEAGRRRAGASEVQESRQQLLTVEAAGWLTKQGALVKNWKPRWFTLSRGELCYYEAVNEISLQHVLLKKTHSLSITGESSARGKIDLLQVYHIHGNRDGPERRPTIELSTVERMFFLRCSSVRVMHKWETVLKEALHAVVVLGEHELHDLRAKVSGESAGATKVRPEARVFHHIVDVDEIDNEEYGSNGSGSGPRAAGVPKAWASAKQKVRQTMDWSKIGDTSVDTASSDSRSTVRSLKLPRFKSSTKGGSSTAAMPTEAAEAVVATGSRRGLSMFAGVLGAVPEGGFAGLGGGETQVRPQRAGSVGVILDQTELTMGSDAMHEETLAAWRNMND